MIDQLTIDSLKANENPYGLMGCSLEERKQMQEAMVSVSFSEDDIEFYNGDDWYPKNKDPEKSAGFLLKKTYRLRPDYEEQPEVSKCEVKEYSSGLKYVWDEDDNELSVSPIADAVNVPDFIGFLYEDGDIRSTARKYVSDKRWGFDDFVSGKVKTLTPTHVLFRGKK